MKRVLFVLAFYCGILFAEGQSLPDEQERVETLFWLFTSSIDDSSVKRFMAESHKLKVLAPTIASYAVLKGFPSKMSEYPNRFVGTDGFDSFKVKINPLIFKKLELQKAPAYALASCKKGRFKTKNCDFKYLVKGDIGLADFFSIIGDEDRQYKEIYFKLIEPK